ncbi:FixH family protein [Brevibacillus brevis]|uniref:FixH family protein n=1 Tax=Brevibacillus brevis TaxID=1393 RepID=UPI0025A60C8D|nr:FixH family protein [Brevibacillus brevis]WJQ82914.1 FixH family protein [Brevibacillus brevis]
MKIYVQFLSILLFSLFLTACSVDKEAVSLYKQEKPLEIDISVPHPVLLNKPQLFKAVLHQNGKVVDDAEEVRFTIWKKDSSNKNETIAATNVDNGVYTVERTIDKEGVYYVKVNASANGSRIMPTKQFIVGEITEEIDSVKKQDPEQNHEHH